MTSGSSAVLSTIRVDKMVLQDNLCKLVEVLMTTTTGRLYGKGRLKSLELYDAMAMFLDEESASSLSAWQSRNGTLSWTSSFLFSPPSLFSFSPLFFSLFCLCFFSVRCLCLHDCNKPTSTFQPARSMGTETNALYAFNAEVTAHVQRRWKHF